MYHGLFSPNYESAVINKYDSTIKIVIDNWYKTNIYDKNLESYIQNQIFCNDRTIYSGDGYTLNGTTKYKPYYRVIYSHKPSLICQNNNDKFTLKENSISTIKGTSGYGNNALNYPVGLITIDEVLLAGSVYDIMNSKNYLYNEYYYWTLSPSFFYSLYASASIWDLSRSGAIDNDHTTTGRGVRPVINLKSNIEFISGSGTESDPYLVG